jgi:hypothetical protein
MIKRRVQVYKVSAMIAYEEIEGTDTVDVLVRAIDKARPEFENPMKRETPDCKFLAVIKEGSEYVSRGHSTKKRSQKKHKT